MRNIVAGAAHAAVPSSSAGLHRVGKSVSHRAYMARVCVWRRSGFIGRITPSGRA